MFENLTQRMHETFKKIRGQARLTEENIADSLREVRVALLEADVALPIVKEFCQTIKEQALGRNVLASLSPAQEFVAITQNALIELLGGAGELNFRVPAPLKIMLVGLQGAGKTTTAGKLARILRSRHGKKRILMASCDLQRPAAQEQLKVLARQTGADYFEDIGNLDPVGIAKACEERARRGHYDALILDTAGRTSVDEELMAEIDAVGREFQPHESLLVLDSMTGQAAMAVCDAFKDRVAVTGLVMTKMDGDSRGGAVLSAKKTTGVPVKFIGTSEKADGLEVFDPARVAGRILGMGDVMAIVEQAYEHRDEQESKKIEDKFRKNKPFDMEDLRSQLAQMRRMGGIGAFMDKLPAEMAAMAAKAPAGVTDERTLARMEAIILSMTPKERANPQLLKATRKKRIAAGAGVQVQEVNRLVKQWETIEGMMKKLRGGGLGKIMKMAGKIRGGALGRTT